MSVWNNVVRLLSVSLLFKHVCKVCLERTSGCSLLMILTFSILASPVGYKGHKVFTKIHTLSAT